MRIRPKNNKSKHMLLFGIMLSVALFVGRIVFYGMANNLLADIFAWSALAVAIITFIAAGILHEWEDDLTANPEKRKLYLSNLQTLESGQNLSFWQKRFVKNYLKATEETIIRKSWNINEQIVKNVDGNKYFSFLVSAVAAENSLDTPIKKENVVVFNDSFEKTFESLKKFLLLQKEALQSGSVKDFCLEFVVFMDQYVSGVHLFANPKNIDEAVEQRSVSRNVFYLVFSTPEQIDQFIKIVELKIVK